MLDELQCLKLARQLVLCRGKRQRKFLMRGQQGTDGDRSVLEGAIARMQRLLKQVPDAESIASRLGLGGNLAALYVV